MSAAYDAGFDHGRDQAVLCCFGGSKMSRPHFDTPAEDDDYDIGYEDGFASVADHE